jgi:hypothetical protein
MKRFILVLLMGSSSALASCTSVGDRISPITGEIISETQGERGRRTSLLGTKFQAGETRQEAEARLRRNGFLFGDGDYQGGWIEVNFPEVRKGAALYLKEGANVACFLEYYVMLQFDEKDRVADAQGAMYADICL